MESVDVNGVKLEYEAVGSGEPVLLIDMLLADCFLPLVSEPALADRYQLIRYHKRGWVGSSHTPPPVSISDHAADAAALLEQLGVRRAHIVGHSTGAAIAAQLALDHRELVHTLILLEPTLVSLPYGQAFLKEAAPVFEAYAGGDHAGAFAMFVAAASGLDWATCRALLEERIPGVVAQSIRDADTFFGIELPALADWTFGAEQAAAINRPVLSVVGADTQPLWVEIADFLRASLPYVEETTIDGVGHLLQIQQSEPVARHIAEFLEQNSMADDEAQLINVKLIEDVFTPDQKREIVERLTDTMVSIEGENMRSVTWVVVEEVASGAWGIGGKPLSTEDVKALAAGAPA